MNKWGKNYFVVVVVVILFWLLASTTNYSYIKNMTIFKQPLAIYLAKLIKRWIPYTYHRANPYLVRVSEFSRVPGMHSSCIDHLYRSLL